jgi:hypothetical protein
MILLGLSVIEMFFYALLVSVSDEITSVSAGQAPSTSSAEVQNSNAGGNADNASASAISTAEGNLPLSHSDDEI